MRRLVLTVITTLTLCGAPASADDIVETARSAGSFGTLLAAVDAAGLRETLLGDGPFTVLAPTDEAFAALPPSTLRMLLRPEAREQLRSILLFHVLPGRLPASELLAAGTSATVQSDPVRFALRSGRLTVNDANVIENDVEADNGVIHVIDRVLLPPAPPIAASTPLGLIEMAVSRGAPLFNAGQPEACTAIYELTAGALIGLGGDHVSDMARRTLRTALQRAANEPDHRERAWIMRRALDLVAHDLTTRGAE